MGGGDVLDVIEKAYRFDLGPTEWLRDLAVSVYEQLGAGNGLLGFYYRIRDDGRVQLGDDVQLDLPAPPPVPMKDALESLPPMFVRKSFARCECTTQSQAADDEMKELVAPIMQAAEAAFGWRDIVMLGGVDPTGYGVYLGAWLPERTRLPPRVRATWSRVAVHIVSAYRLRRRLDALEHLGPDRADAVLTPHGRVEHARGEAEERDARQALRQAVREIETARGRLRRNDPHVAVDSWKGLVSTRWSLIDHFDSDGRRYVLARRNDPVVAGLEALTDRERQAVGWAALGHGNKLIAYEMGISPSTVGVLLHRAARKLGAGSRAALIDEYVAARTRASSAADG